MSNYKLISDVAVSENGFLFQPVTGESFTLNSVGIIILAGLKASESSQEIISAIIDEYDIDETTAERDFTEFINQLKNYKLVSEK